jgi:hypothetical protein
VTKTVAPASNAAVNCRESGTRMPYCARKTTERRRRAVDSQRPHLFRVEQGPFVSLNQILATLALRVHTRFDKSDDRGDSLYLGLFEVTKQVLGKGKIASMSLPQVDEGRRIHADDDVSHQILF